MTGPYYDTLRHAGVPTLGLDHVPGEVAEMGIRKMRPLGSVRSINRPRQTWAMKAGQATKNGDGNIVPVTYRLNYVNGGSPGREFECQTPLCHHFEPESARTGVFRASPSYVT